MRALGVAWLVCAALLLAIVASACGPDAETTTQTAANVAQRAQDPRRGDLTAAAGPSTPADPTGPSSTSPTNGPTAGGSGGSGGSGAASGASVRVDPAVPDPHASTDSLVAQARARNAATAPIAGEPKKISARHVLIQYMGAQAADASVVRTREQARALAEEVLKRAREGADMGRLAAEYSDEPNAGSRGGSLGRFGRGAMVPAFEDAAFKLKVGEISGIVETPFGFHVIQRTE